MMSICNIKIEKLKSGVSFLEEKQRGKYKNWWWRLINEYFDEEGDVVYEFYIRRKYDKDHVICETHTKKNEIEIYKVKYEDIISHFIDNRHNYK
jgi:hypothetical protein